MVGREICEGMAFRADVILNRGEATEKDRTRFGRVDAVKKNRCACSNEGPVRCILALRIRKIPRGGCADAQDDILR